MNENERQALFSGNSHLILEEDVGKSSMVVRLPWLPKKRARAEEERSSLLRQLLSIWKSALFVYDNGSAIQRKVISCDLGLDVFTERQELGSWILVFGQIDHAALSEIWDDDKLASMSAESLFESSGAPCIIVSEPDDIEWTILFANE